MELVQETGTSPRRDLERLLSAVAGSTPTIDQAEECLALAQQWKEDVERRDLEGVLSQVRALLDSRKIPYADISALLLGRDPSKRRKASRISAKRKREPIDAFYELPDGELARKGGRRSRNFTERVNGGEDPKNWIITPERKAELRAQGLSR